MLAAVSGERCVGLSPDTEPRAGPGLAAGRGTQAACSRAPPALALKQPTTLSKATAGFPLTFFFNFYFFMDHLNVKFVAVIKPEGCQVPMHVL